MWVRSTVPVMQELKLHPDFKTFCCGEGGLVLWDYQTNTVYAMYTCIDAGEVELLQREGLLEFIN